MLMSYTEYYDYDYDFNSLFEPISIDLASLPSYNQTIEESNIFEADKEYLTFLIGIGLRTIPPLTITYIAGNISKFIR